MPVKPLMKTAMKVPKRKTVKRVTKRKIRCHPSVSIEAIAKWKDKSAVSTTRDTMRRGVVLNLKRQSLIRSLKVDPSQTPPMTSKYIFCVHVYLCPTAALMNGTVTVGIMHVIT